MMSLEEFARIKKEWEKKSSENEQKKGELKQIFRSLKEEYGCESLEEAKELLEQNILKSNALETRLEKKTQELKEKWEDFSNE